MVMKKQKRFVFSRSINLSKASIRKQKSAVASLFIIIALVSALCTIGVSMILGVMPDLRAGIDRLHSPHSVLVMTKDMYNSSFEEIILSDPRVTEYDIGEAIYNSGFKLNYSGEVESHVVILNAADERKVSAPRIIGDDGSVPRETAVYLPTYAQNIGYSAGSRFTITYRNKPIDLTVAGFFESADFTSPNGLALKFFAADECYEVIKRETGSYVWIAIRFNDPYDSAAFNDEFRSQIDVEIPGYANESMVQEFSMIYDGTITPTMILSVIILLFAIIIILIALLITRFRINNNIEGSMHSIGVLKASGYTSGQIIVSYLAEHSIIALPAVIFGLLLTGPVFPVIRAALKGMTGFAWTLGANIPAGIIAAALIVAALLAMVLLSCRKIRKLPPVVALRGGIASDSRRRNLFPLRKGAGNVSLRLGLKSSAAFFRQYVMIGVIITAATFAMIIIAALYQNFVVDYSALIRMTGIEMSDVDLTVARDTDADALAAELELLPEVRKTSMFDWGSFLIDGVDVMGVVSNDFSLMESMSAHEGRFPIYDNEIAIPRLLADRLGKELGDSVSIKANEVARESIICGYFSTSNSGGQMGAITLEGYQRLDPYYHRTSIKVYLNEGATFGAFNEILKTNYDVVNEENVLMSGSSGKYQIETITDFNEWAKTLVAAYGDIVKLLTQVVTVISLGIIALILAMTVRQSVVKRRRELGILKSGGFTTAQLARQLAISILPYSIVGTLVGCVCGALAVNPAITAMFASSGVYNANVHISPPVAAVIGLLALAFTFAVSHLSAMRIRRVTVYELLSE